VSGQNEIMIDIQVTLKYASIDAYRLGTLREF